jgi:hypothetical protein
LLLAKEIAQLRQCGIRSNGNDVGPRRHDLAHERLGEVDDRLKQLASFLLRDRVLLFLLSGG